MIFTKKVYTEPDYLSAQVLDGVTAIVFPVGRVGSVKVSNVVLEFAALV